MAVRRVEATGDQSVRFKVFDAAKSMVANLQATSRAWTTSGATYPIGPLTAGQEIYFAVDRDGTYAYDATEVIWTVHRTGGSTPAACPVGQFRAEYFNNVTLSGTPAFTRCETTINYTWAGGGPGNGLGTDNFSVRWTGRHQFTAGQYTFAIRTDDGARVKLDGQIIHDAWKDQGAVTYQVNQTVTAGEHDVVMEYYERGGGAVAYLWWSQVNISAPITTSSLCSPRPPVGVKVERNAPGRLAVTVTANTSTSRPNNAIESILVGGAPNAAVEVTGRPATRGDVSISVPPGSREVTFVVTRLGEGAVTLPLVVTDGCGEWRTFVGGGADAF